MAITALVTVLHSTPADASFTPAGVAAWDGAAAHNVVADVTGYAAVADTGAYADLSGTPSIPSLSDAWPIGSVYVSTRSTSPAILLGFGTWAAIEAQFLVGVKSGDPDFGAGASGGATGVAAVGTVSQPAFVGDAYTPSGTNAGVSYTPSGTIDMTLYIAKGANSVSQFTASGSVSFPATVPTFAGAQLTVTPSVNWPAGVPTFAGTSHRHELPIIHTEATVLRLLPTATFGVGASRAPDAALAAGTLVANTTTSGVVMMSNTATAAGVISWPASVPQAVASGTPAGTLTWPSGAPAFVGAAQTVPAQVFSGTVGSGSAVFSGLATTLAAQVFTGVSKAPTGTVSKPTFGGDKTAVLPPYRTAYFWERTA